jgi:hypothetical protein
MSDSGIKEILQKNTGEWMNIPGVTGTGIGVHNDEPCIIIFVTELTEQIKKQIPERIGNTKVVIEQSGLFEARN